MKKVILLTISFCLLVMPFAMAQSEKDIPAVVKNTFNSKYPGMKVTDWDWDEEKEAYEAEFKMNGREAAAYFTVDGNWKKTRIDIKREQLPAAVIQAMNTGEYKTWDKSDYTEFDMPEGKRYKIRVRKGVDFVYLKYDSNGTQLEHLDKKDDTKK